MPAPGPKKRMAARCPVCGKAMSRAGLVGHMAWKHGRDSRRPLLPSKPHPVREARRKATFLDFLLADQDLPDRVANAAMAIISKKAGWTAEGVCDVIRKSFREELAKLRQTFNQS